MTTLASFDVRVVERLGVSSADTRLTATARTRAINDALQQISLAHDFPWNSARSTFSTVIGVGRYPVPADWYRTTSLISVGSGRNLIQVPLSHVDSYEASNRSGNPTVYAIDGNYIYLGPIPGSNVTINHRYYRVEPTLVNPQDSANIPAVYDEGVVDFACHRLLLQVRESERSRECLADYQSWIKRVQDNIKQSREPMRVRVRPGAWI